MPGDNQSKTPAERLLLAAFRRMPQREQIKLLRQALTMRNKSQARKL